MDNSIALGFHPETNSIRQVPDNYLIAYKRYERWVIDPDRNSDKELCLLLLEAIFDYEVRYGDGYGVISAVTKLKEEKRDVE